MQLVVDSNQLQGDRLRSFLSKSPANVAVLTDYAAMEAHKGDTLSSIFRSMSVLGEFPRQVVVLKGTALVCGLRGRPAGLQRRLVDQSQTAGFPEYIRHLKLAKAGNRRFEKRLLELGRDATAHLDRMLGDACEVGKSIAAIGATLTKDERSAIRRGEAYSSSFVDKTVRRVIEFSGALFRMHPNANRVPSYEELPNTFLFRAALCAYLLAHEWSAQGGAKDARPETIRNDIVDLYFAAYATYFDGLLTDDCKAGRIHQEARIWLSALFDTHLPSGCAGYCPE
jgi:hypothetical protein